MEKSVLRDPGFYVMVAIGLAAMLILPVVLDMFTIMQITQYVVLAVFALSLGYIWGFGGILSLVRPPSSGSAPIPSPSPRSTSARPPFR